MKHLTRTKIVATIGPASETVASLTKMMEAGMRVARLNFSHGDYEAHARLIKNVRAAAKSLGIEVAILQDLQGPRIRVGDVAKDGVPVSRGSRVALVPQSKHVAGVAGNITIPIQYEQLYRDVKAGTIILIEDGTIQLKVVSVRGHVIYCKTKVAGVIKTHKGINVPGVTLTVDVITDKDKHDVAFGQEHDVDYVALSFVRDASDIVRLKELIKKHQPKGQRIATKVIAKIERVEALENLDGILEAVDGVMVARGDLGLEIPAQEVPLWQKELVARSLSLAKPVIVATQMLDSMIRNPQPTRAEVSDVANAVIDHTDAVMLSGESATGKYPIEAVSMMTKIAATTEASGFDDLHCGPFAIESRVHAVALAACGLSKDIPVKAIMVASLGGDSVRVISRHHPELPILAITPERKTARQLALSWGVVTHVIPASTNLQSLMKRGLEQLKKMHMAQDGDLVVFVAGEPFGKVHEMNALRIVRVGEPLV